MRERGRDRHRALLHGPVRLRRIEGVWKVEDYRVNGRLRSSSLRLRPAGAQEVDDLRVSTVAADLRGDATYVYLRIENRRHAPTELDWGALGSRRGRRWAFAPFDLLVAEIPPAATVLVGGGTWKVLPLDTRELRLILVERGKRVGFDFIVNLAPAAEELEAVQRPPEALPLRLRLLRSPLGLTPLLLLLALVFWLGSWASLGMTLGAMGGLLLLALAWHRIRGRSIRARRPAAVGGGLLAIGLVILLFAGFPFAGCPSRTEARKPADRFALALLAGDREAAGDLMAPGTEPIREQLPRLGPIPASDATEIVRTGYMERGTACLLFPVPSLPGFPNVDDDLCVVYDLPIGDRYASGRLTVYVRCESGRWEVVGFG